MINIEQITSRLAKLPDQQLQQYAAMHKSDPYIMALAVSESNRRKQMRASAQAGPAQEQPKVADMALAGMSPQQSPDEAGIASLPAEEMNFADGGIIGYADGGGTYETTADRYYRSVREQEARDRAAREAQAAEQGVMPYGEQMRRMGSAFAGIPGTVLNTLVSAPGYGLSNLVSAPTAKPSAAPTASAASITPAKPTPQQIEAAGHAGPTPKAEAGLGGTPEAAALRRTPGVGAPSVTNAKALAGQFYDTKEAKDALEKYQEDEAAAVAAARARRAEGKPEGKTASKYEELLAAEGATEGKERDDAVSTAILRLGIGMMGGTSPNAFKNIADAAGPALTEYGSALKDLKKSAKERQKAMADIEAARRAEERDDWKSKNEFEDKAETRMATARKYGVDFIKDVTGKSAEIASKIYDRQIAEAASTQRTGMQVAAMQDRATGKLELTQKDRAMIADKAMDNVNATLKANVPLQIKAAKDPAYLQQLVQAETARLMAAAGGTTMAPAPGAASPGGTSTTGWGKASVVNP